jgi:hypothetical protein
MTVSIPMTCRPLIAAVMLAVAAASGCATPGQQATLAQRVRLLEDKQAITTLLERFFEYQETRQMVNYANLFAKDGEMILRQGRSSGGPAGILGQRGANATNTPVPASTIRMRHILSNVYIDVKGDTAEAQSRFTLLSVDDDNRPRLGGSGRYKDDLVRENGQWKILKRVIYRDLPLDLENANPEPE